MDHNEIIDKLSKLVLIENPIKEVKMLLGQFDKYGVVETILHPRKLIIRARLSDKNSFKEVSQLSYKPQKFNSEYQRASTPFQTMFYGSIVPEILGETEPTTARITSMYEVCSELLDINSIFEKDITFSVWEVLDDIKLVSLIHHEMFERPTKLSQELMEQYKLMIAENPKFEKPSIEISRFLGEQFAKSPIKSQYDYLISAVYSELMSLKYDGVLYPSTRLSGEGINITLRPDVVKTKLRFLQASECTVYKNRKNVFLGNSTSTIFDGKGNLIYNRLPSQIFVSRKEGRKAVNIIRNSSV